MIKTEGGRIWRKEETNEVGRNERQKEVQRRESKKGEMEEGNEEEACDYYRQKAEEK